MSTAEQAIGRLIQEQRRVQGLTQEQLSRKADVAYTTLTKVESGAIKNPSMQFVQKVSRALHVSIDALLVPHVFRGESSLNEIWRDILDSGLSSGDSMCISGIDESTFLAADRKALLDFIEEIGKRGYKQKLICCEGDKNFLPGEHLEYRSIPREHFNPTPMYVYRDKVAFLIWGPPQQALILENSFLADAFRKQFHFIWERAKPERRAMAASPPARRKKRPRGS